MRHGALAALIQTRHETANMLAADASPRYRNAVVKRGRNLFAFAAAAASALAWPGPAVASEVAVPPRVAADRSILAATPATVGQTVFLAERGSEGLFALEASDNVRALLGHDPAQGVYVRSTAAAGGVWVRRTNSLHPSMFGAAGDGKTDDGAALQAFFDFAQPREHAARYVFDWRGEFAIGRTIFATYADGGAFGNAPERRFVMGTLRVLPVASPLETVLEIAGPRQSWSGKCGIHPSGAVQYGSAYALRRYVLGIRMRSASGTTFGDCIIDDAKRDLLFADSRAASGFTVRAGTPQEARFPNANNIGLRIGSVYGRTFGSTHVSASNFGIATPIRAKLHGGVSGIQYAQERFAAEPGRFAGSYFQRSRLAVGSTGDMAVYDLIKTRLELTPSTYGTVAYDAAASRIVWTRGDPASLFAPGDLYPVAASGPNAAIPYRILRFEGPGNRQIKVTPAPRDQAPSADPALAQSSAWSFHTVSSIEGEQAVLVYPWVPDRNNSAAYLVHGAAFRLAGGDAANTQIGYVGALVGGAAYWGHSLYAPRIGSILADHAEVGLRLSVPGESDNHLGLAVEHGHLEAVTAGILSHSGNVTGSINIRSAFDLAGAISDQPRVNVNDQLGSPGTLGSLQIHANGMVFNTPVQSVNEGSDWSRHGVSNAPHNREIFVHSDSATLTVAFDRDVARLFPKHHWARIVWTDDDGSAPDGKLTLTLDPSLAALGWTFAGQASDATFAVSDPGATVALDVRFLTASRKVAITRRSADR
jgi:hypothetical protein